MDSMGKTNITNFCNLNFVKTTLFFSDVQEVAKLLEIIGDFYYSFLQKIEFLPMETYKTHHVEYFDFTHINTNDPAVLHVLDKLKQEDIVSSGVVPIYYRYTADESMHLVAGFARMKDQNNGILHMLQLCLPKKLIKSVPQSVTTVKDIIESYHAEDKHSLRELVKSKGHSYNQFQKDCKIYLGDTFYSFLLKMKMIEAAGDVIFTDLSYKEIAFKNKFADYPNMYKTFMKYGISFSEIPRLANI